MERNARQDEATVKFDENGFIFPYDKIDLSFDDFKTIFVTNFPIESTRHEKLIDKEFRRRGGKRKVWR